MNATAAETGQAKDDAAAGATGTSEIQRRGGSGGAPEKIIEEQETRNTEMKTKINRMVMQGFKSFAERTEVLFGDKFNVIMGPNGSGKSNVFDAICFVLGKSSAKSMRAEKAANLIYNGGRNKQQLKQAEVSIFFDNKQKGFNSDEEEVKISRIVKKNGTSTYKINNITVTRQQVLELLGSAKINPDGFNIILQGDVQEFVMQSPVDRRKMIEDIAGIGIYEERKEKALRELDRVEERLREADIVLNEKGRHLRELKKDRDQAMKYKDLSDKIKVNKASHLWRQIKQKRAEKEKYDKLVMESQGQIDKMRSDIEALRKENEAKKTEIKRIISEVEEQGQKEQIEMNKQIEDLKVKTALNRTKVRDIGVELNKLEERKTELRNQAKEAKDKEGLLLGEMKAAKESKDTKKAELEQINGKIEEFRKKHSLDNQHELDKEIEEIDGLVEEKQDQVAELREKQQELMRQKDKLELQIESYDEKIAKVAEVESEHKESIEELRNKKTRFKQATLQLNKKLNEDSTLAASVQHYRAEVQKLTEKKSKLEVRAISQKERAAGDLAVKEVMKRKDKLGKVYGTVSDIGKVDSKYALALSVAAGARLKSIVVQDDATAAKCIKFLRSEKLGVAAFLPMTKIKGRADKMPTSFLKAEGVVGLAADLIDYESRFKKVFDYVFGKTLVVNTIEVARRLGIGLARMVTLDGDLCETTGAMIGGFRKKQGIGFKEKGLEAELDTAEADLSKAQSGLENIQNRREELEEEIQELRKEKATLEGEIIKLEKSMHLEDSDLDATRRQKELLREQAKKVDKEFEEIVEQISEVNKEFAELKMRKSDIRNKISQLRNPTVLAELAAFQEKKKELDAEIIELDGIYNNKKMQLESVAKPETQRITNLGSELQKEETKFKEELDSAKKILSEQQTQLNEKEKAAQKFYEEFKESFDKRNKLQSEITANEEKIFKKEEANRQKEQIINTASVDMAEIKGALAGLDEQFEQYRDVKIDESKPDDVIRKEIQDFEKIVAEIGSVNLRALEVYDAAEAEHGKLLKKKEVLRKEKDDVMVMIEEIDARKKDIFMKTFNKLNSYFMAFFQELSAKGEAFLEVENPEDPFLEGVTFKVRISGNKFLDIRGLSGGEKTLTSLAFLFAIQEFEPASFYVMDEVDAALDNFNSDKLAKLIRKYCKNAQYVVASHKESLIMEADLLYGVSMKDNNISKIVSIKA